MAFATFVAPSLMDAGNGHTEFQIMVDGMTVEYHVILRPDGKYSVGTYYIP